MKKTLKGIILMMLMVLVMGTNLQVSYASNYPVPKRTLYYKTPTMKGDDVKYVQSGLKTLGYNITVDGSFGPGARDTTKKFQKDNKITVNGKFDSSTLKKLQEKLKKAQATKKLTYNQNSVVGNIKESKAYKDKNYKEFFKKVNYSQSKNFIIPGLDSSMIPQGMCDAGNYILISAYDKKEAKDSCIHVINKSTGKLVKTVYISGNKSHVGGIAYDGTYVWVANGTKYTVSRIKLSDIINNTKDGKSVKHSTYNLRTMGGSKVTGSFATYSNGILWIGQFNAENDTYVYGFKMEGSSLKARYRISIPKKIQGITFMSNGKVVLSQSYGRNSASKILVYNKPSYTTKDGVKYANLGKATTTVTAPPASQNMFIGNDNLLYILFESAADHYRNGRDGKGKANTPVDRVCPITIK